MLFQYFEVIYKSLPPLKCTKILCCYTDFNTVSVTTKGFYSLTSSYSQNKSVHFVENYCLLFKLRVKAVRLFQVSGKLRALCVRKFCTGFVEVDTFCIQIFPIPKMLNIWSLFTLTLKNINHLLRNCYYYLKY